MLPADEAYFTLSGQLFEENSDGNHRKLAGRTLGWSDG